MPATYIVFVNNKIIKYKFALIILGCNVDRDVMWIVDRDRKVVQVFPH